MDFIILLYSVLPFIDPSFYELSVKASIQM